jgi:putative transposase
MVGAIDLNRLSRLNQIVPLLHKRLDHTTHFAGRFGAKYFITVCAQRRGVNTFCHSDIAQGLLKTARIYHENQRWFLVLLLPMPDHLHALIGIDDETSLSSLIRDYKRATKRTIGVNWQRNFFDHRLRHDESLSEKFDYIFANPLRAGLITANDKWPYVFSASDEGDWVNRPYLL